jgi:hypothetical protein
MLQKLLTNPLSKWVGIALAGVFIISSVYSQVDLWITKKKMNRIQHEVMVARNEVDSSKLVIARIRGVMKAKVQADSIQSVQDSLKLAEINKSLEYERNRGKALERKLDGLSSRISDLPHPDDL